MNQLQMPSVFGSCRIGDRVSDDNCHEYVKESHNVGRHTKTNEPYYFDLTDRVYVDAGTNREIASKYFAMGLPDKGSIVNMRV